MGESFVVVILRLSFVSLLTAGCASVSLQNNLQQIRKKYKVSALGGALLAGDEIKVVEVVGTRTYRGTEAVTREDRFHLGSCAKAMTATLAAVLIEEGKLKWKTPLYKIFSGIHQTHRLTTIEELSAHRGGLLGNLIKFDNGRLLKRIANKKLDPKLDPKRGRQILVKQLLSRPPKFKPGGRFLYSNAGYVVLGAALEQVTGLAWEELMKSKIFEPLKMVSCGFGAPGSENLEVPVEPWGHEDFNSIRTESVPPDFFADNPPALGPAGNIHCSLSDWLKFLRAHVQGHFGTKNILKPESYKKLHASYPGQDYTYGGWIRVQRAWAGGPALTHAGSNTLFYANSWVALNKGVAIVAATNHGNRAAMKATDEVIDILWKKYYEGTK